MSEFEKQVPGEYDIAIDLRTDSDSRILLESARARVKAALGTKTHFPFLDIFLPIDVTRHGVERAWELELQAHRFNAGSSCWRNHFEIMSRYMEPNPEEFAVVWGPYERLGPGKYRFEPFSEVDSSRPGILRCDVALNTRRVAEHTFSSGHIPALEFTNLVDDAEFEFRLYALAGEPVPTFRFYGGRLIKQGANGVLQPVRISVAAGRAGRPAGQALRDAERAPGGGMNDIIIAPFSNSSIRDWPPQAFHGPDPTSGRRRSRVRADPGGRHAEPAAAGQ